MKKRIKKYLTIAFFTLFFVLFISNNSKLESFAKKVEDEMIRPYALRYLSESDTLVTNNYPISSNIEATPDPVKKTDTNVPTPTAEPAITIVYVTPTPLDVFITEEDLWSSLSSYRSNHGKSDLLKSDSLCQYARDRARELSDRLATNPDDPLDNHAGFSRDADSGHVFELTGFNSVGENLAYTPGYTTATQIIEWGWDTSPGHRSLQLSTDITHACIFGIHPIYVGIYTY